MKSLFTLTLMGLLGGAVFSNAATIEAKYLGYSGGTVSMSTNSGASFSNVGGGVFRFERVGGTYGDDPVMYDPANNRFYTMCFEPLQSISAGATLTWVVGDLSDGNSTKHPFTATQVALLEELFGRHWPDLSLPIASANDALSMQLAVWEIVQEAPANGLDVTAGQIRFNSNLAGVLTQANNWLTELLPPGGPMASGLKTMVNDGRQDYIFQIGSEPPQEIPEPTHLLGGGLLILLALRRRLG